MKEIDAKKHMSRTDKPKKKKKKKLKKKKHSSSSSNSDSESCEMMWVEAPPPPTLKTKLPAADPPAEESTTSNKKERDSWMNEELFVPTLSKKDLLTGSARERKLAVVKEKQEKEEKIQKERELNPYWQNDGKGVPETETCIENLALPATSVGDGGYSWLKKAYLRIQEQSQREGRPMEEVAVERWGSLDKLVSLIEEAESRMNKNRDDRREYSSRKRREEREREYRKSERGESFRRPRDNEYQSKHSPEYSVKFRKPNEDHRHKKKSLHFKSSEKHKSHEICTKVDNEKTSESSKTLSKIIERDDNDSRKKINSTEPEYDNEFSRKSIKEDRNDHRPAWKKTSYMKEVEQNIDQTEKGAHIPAWKKQKFLKENDRKSEEKFLDFSDETSQPQAEENGRRKEKSSEQETHPVSYSEDDLRQLAAKYFKADLMGDSELAGKLKKQLEEARHLVDKNLPGKQNTRQQEVILTKVDSHGQAHPLQISQQDRLSAGPSSRKQRKNKYFNDGSKYSLKQMFEREKLTTMDDNLEMFMDVASECKETTDIDYEPDDVSTKISQKMSHSRQEERDIGKAIRQHQRLSAAVEKCCYCLDQPNMKQHLIVTAGEQIYLCLPNFQSLVESHCLIVPKQHVPSFLHLDEDEWIEVEEFKRTLRNMFKLQKKRIIFLETSMNFRYCPHAVLECIPVPEETSDLAPLYFKKAIQESEAEWAHNQKLVDLTSKGLRHSVPKNLPYFFVEFDPRVHAGYAHVIEDEKYFPKNFGKEVIGGMLDIDYHYLYKNKREDPLKKCQEVLEFEKAWSKFKEENDMICS